MFSIKREAKLILLLTVVSQVFATETLLQYLLDYEEPLLLDHEKSVRIAREWEMSKQKGVKKGPSKTKEQQFLQYDDDVDDYDQVVVPPPVIEPEIDDISAYQQQTNYPQQVTNEYKTAVYTSPPPIIKPVHQKDPTDYDCPDDLPSYRVGDKCKPMGVQETQKPKDEEIKVAEPEKTYSHPPAYVTQLQHGGYYGHLYGQKPPNYLPQENIEETVMVLGPTKDEEDEENEYEQKKDKDIEEYEQDKENEEYEQGHGNAGYGQVEQGTGNGGYDQVEYSTGNAGYDQVEQGTGNAGYDQVEQGTGNAGYEQVEQGTGNAGYEQVEQGTGNAGYEQGTGNEDYEKVVTGNGYTDQVQVVDNSHHKIPEGPSHTEQVVQQYQPESSKEQSHGQQYEQSHNKEPTNQQTVDYPTIDDEGPYGSVILGTDLVHVDTMENQQHLKNSEDTSSNILFPAQTETESQFGSPYGYHDQQTSHHGHKPQKKPERYDSRPQIPQQHTNSYGTGSYRPVRGNSYGGGYGSYGGGSIGNSHGIPPIKPGSPQNPGSGSQDWGIILEPDEFDIAAGKPQTKPQFEDPYFNGVIHNMPYDETPAIPGAFTCFQRKEGYYADYHSGCKRFYRCAKGHFQAYEYVCPYGTKFNDHINQCDHEDQVACSQKHYYG